LGNGSAAGLEKGDSEPDQRGKVKTALKEVQQGRDIVDVLVKKKTAGIFKKERSKGLARNRKRGEVS